MLCHVLTCTSNHCPCDYLFVGSKALHSRPQATICGIEAYRMLESYCIPREIGSGVVLRTLILRRHQCETVVAILTALDIT